MAKKKRAEEVYELFLQSETRDRQQWEFINQKGYDFAHDNQLSEQEKKLLEEQGMPTFTINRIIPVVEMLNFYATAQTPRWQAVGNEGSDSDVAAVFADIADYIWHHSNGQTLYSNAVNDAVTKSVGYLLVTVDHDADRGMGEVIVQQPDPFDVFPDPKSRDLLFRDASYVFIRKVLPKGHLKALYPDQTRKINAASSRLESEMTYSEKSTDAEQKDFHYKDIHAPSYYTDEDNDLLDYYELYEKIKVPYVNVFYRAQLSKDQLKQIKQEVSVRIDEMRKELAVELEEQRTQMEKAVLEEKMIPERMQLEMEKATQQGQQQIMNAEKELVSKLQQDATKIENKVITKAELKELQDNQEFAEMIVDIIPFNESRIKQTCVVGDKVLYEKILPITEYPIIPIHFKWTGTPFPISAVSPLIGKQREINKAHQILVHNASLGSSLRWVYEEGSIDKDYWEQFGAAPGALLPKRKGFEAPQPVMPMSLSNAFFGIVQEGKQDMEYLAGIYSSMQGDTGRQHETFRGMLAMDEYGTRRIKYWLKNSIEPALKQVGEVVKQLSQQVYTAHKVFRIVQPSGIQEERTVEINIPMYNNLGRAIGKFKDYGAAKFDVRIIAGSTLPVNRWAYLAELKELMQLGVVDDIAVLSETDVRNKENIAKRKSMYAQMRSQIGGLEEAIKDKDGAIETLERQLVQAGIKNKVMQGSMEIDKKVNDTKGRMESEYLETEAQQKLLRGEMDNEAELTKDKVELLLKNLQNTEGKS